MVLTLLLEKILDMMIDRSIFKAYDIRGVVGKTLTAEVAYRLGLVLGDMARRRNIGSLCVARDGRLSGPELSEALINGIADAGTDVKNIGMVPTPVLYFATEHLGNGSGVAVTGSHNPADYNGFKMMMGGSHFLVKRSRASMRKLSPRRLSRWPSEEQWRQSMSSMPMSKRLLPM